MLMIRHAKNMIRSCLIVAISATAFGFSVDSASAAVSCSDGNGRYRPNSGIIRHSDGRMTGWMGSKEFTIQVLKNGRVDRAAIKQVCNFMIKNGFGYYTISDDAGRFPKTGSVRTRSKRL